jgi:hypothetical protein
VPIAKVVPLDKTEPPAMFATPSRVPVATPFTPSVVKIVLAAKTVLLTSLEPAAMVALPVKVN